MRRVIPLRTIQYFLNESGPSHLDDKSCIEHSDRILVRREYITTERAKRLEAEASDCALPGMNSRIVNPSERIAAHADVRARLYNYNAMRVSLTWHFSTQNLLDIDLISF